MHRLKVIFINTIRGFSVSIFGFIITIFGIKLFGKSDWGSIIEILLWVYALFIITNFGNKEYLVRSYSRCPSKISHLYLKSFLSRSPFLILSLLYFLFLETEIAFLCILLLVVMYCYSSLDSIIQYHQKFGLQLLSDIISFLTTSLLIYFSGNFNLKYILLAFVAGAIMKTGFLFYRLRIFNQNLKPTFSINELKNYVPFFIVTFLGWISTKIDMYIVTLNLDKIDISEYQIINNSYILVTAGFAFAITPFSKHIYRLPISTINKIKTKLNIIAIPYLIICSLAIWFIMEELMRLNININYYYLSSLKALFPLFFILDIMILNKRNLEKKVTFIILIGLLTNLICLYILIEEYKVIGVIISACISQLVLLITYKIGSRVFI